MKLRMMLGGVLLMTSLGVIAAAEPTVEQVKSKEALMILSEFIGKWNGNGAAEGGKDLWKEGMTLGWKFNKDGDSWLVADFAKSKLYTGGELKYDLKKKVYQFTVNTADKKTLAFEGEFKKGILEMYAIDDASKDKTRLSISTNNEGARLIYNVALQPKSKGFFKKTYGVSHAREGVELAGGKKQECIVTGGLGTMPVSHGGKTYYVCCSGCRDAFNEDPAKFVREFEAKQKKK